MLNFKHMKLPPGRNASKLLKSDQNNHLFGSKF
jgi:hypothetical protein